MKQLHKQATTLMVRGVIAVIFGIIALFAPTIGLQILVLLFGAYAFADGLSAFFVGIKTPSFIVLIEGIIGITAGLYILFMTQQAVSIFITVVAIWAIVTGILEIIAALELRKYIKNEMWMLFVGIASIIFGLFVFMHPLASALAITFVFGIYAVMFGIFLMVLSQSLKSLKVVKAKKR